MRLSIRYQLLIPLLALLVSVVGMSAWTAWSSAQRARRQIAAQMEAVATTVNAVPLPCTPQALNLMIAKMKGLSGADFLICDETGQPLLDDDGRPVSTLPATAGDLPPLTEHADGDLGAAV